MFSRPIFKNPTLPASPPLRFPQKLWKIANECQTGAVCWSPDGKSILLRYSLFREEFMSTKSDFFKTDNISSFVRQLNLYGFRKVYDHAHKQAYKANPDLHEFSNTCFQRDRPDLLDKVTRKSGVLKDKNEIWPESNKSMDFSDESSNDKFEIPDISAKAKDHSYLCIISNEIPQTSSKKPVEKIASGDLHDATIEKRVSMQISSANKENEAVQMNSNIPEQSIELPVKKKRGRKPGSKRNKTQMSEKSYDGPKIYYMPSLKNPEKYPKLLLIKDDDDTVFLRNTSKDVMLSSTLPFQETPEYRALKEEYRRLCDINLKYARYCDMSRRTF